MGRLIDADALLAALFQMHVHDGMDLTPYVALDDIARAIEDAKSKTMSDNERFLNLRKAVDAAVQHAWESGEPGKSYEGAWEVTHEYPPTDEGGAEKGATFTQIVLHCYLLGPSRHYSWRGKTYAEALTRCERDVYAWCKYEMEADNGETEQDSH